jgi:hypothetical protein
VPYAPQAAVAQPVAHRREFQGARPLVSAIIGLALLVPAAAAHPQPAAAASSCTGWPSRTEPPTSIRVLRLSGRVEKVDFRRYVAVVMGSGEWPYSLPRAALEAGAVAVKQFAWYHTLHGHHRRGLVTATGQCYDVRDTTQDQLYRPERAVIRNSQWRAIDRTWAISLRKKGAFMLTQYRAGRKRPCASDVNGRWLVERSAVACARNGWSAEQILAAYYGPRLTIVGGSGTTARPSTPKKRAPTPQPTPPPSPTEPTVELTDGLAEVGIPAALSWSAADPEDQLRYRLEEQVDGEWQRVEQPDLTQQAAPILLLPTNSRQFRIRAIAASGARSDWTAVPEQELELVDPASRSIVWRGNWQRYRDPAMASDTLTNSGLPGSSATFRLTGRSLALVGSRGPGGGVAQVYVDDELVAEIDLGAPVREANVVFFAYNWPAPAARTIRLEVGGEGNGRVDLDSIVTLR